MQRYRLIDALLETGVEFSYAWKDVNIIPARTLPPKALVIAVTPLLDERSIMALHDLRARGHDLAIVEVSPEELVEPGEGSTFWRTGSGSCGAQRCARDSSAPASPWLDGATTAARRGPRGGEGIQTARAAVAA